MDLLWKERKRIWCGLPLTFTVYSYDNERFYVKSGFLNQRQDEVRLYRIQDLTVTRSLSQRIFGMGTILVNSSDKTLGDFEIKNRLVMAPLTRARSGETRVPNQCHNCACWQNCGPSGWRWQN